MLIAWIMRAIPFGTVIMFGALGEIITEKSGNLNLGVPGIMYLGGFAGFAAAYLYEFSNPTGYVPFVGLLLALVCAFAAASLGGLIYSFITTTLRANQNVTGLAMSIFGQGVANFFGAYLLNGKTATQTAIHHIFQQKIPFLSGLGGFGQIFFSYGFMVYAAILLALVLHYFLNGTRTGLNLRAVGENAATADAAGISVTRYKYTATCLGAGISGLGGLYYVLDYNNGIWATTDQIEALGWLAVALVIFTTWKPRNAIWGSYLFGMLYWLYQFLPSLLGFTVASYLTDLIQMVPYVVTIAVLVVTSLRKRQEDQPPQSLGLPYFREER